MRPLTALVILAAALGGCGISNPYTSSNATTAAAAPPVSTATATDADPTSERGGSIPRAAQHNQLATNAAEPKNKNCLDVFGVV